VVDLSCGSTHSLAVTHDGAVYAWGKNQKGQLGTGDGKEYHKPTLLVSLLGTAVKQVACGWDHSLAVTRDHRLFSWGGGYENRPVTGHGAGVDQPLPKVVRHRHTEREEGVECCALVASSHHRFARLRSGGSTERV
jgi:alpha-tubulin suppressor-like RCC1 family protein